MGIFLYDVVKTERKILLKPKSKNYELQQFYN